MKANLFRVKVRRDAHTITPTVVTEHEIAILQTIFGEENIQTLEGGLIDSNTLKHENAVGQMDVSDSEFERLTAKYGANEKGVLVEQVYGSRAARALDKVIKENATAIAAAEKKVRGSTKPDDGAKKDDDSNETQKNQGQ